MPAGSSCKRAQPETAKVREILIAARFSKLETGVVLQLGKQ